MIKLFLCLVLVFFLCLACAKHATKKNKRPDTLHIQGVIKDKNTLEILDSVEIHLDESQILGSPITRGAFYSDSFGKFDFQFSPEKEKAYSLDCSKRGYCPASCVRVYIDLEKESQDFLILLE